MLWERSFSGYALHLPSGVLLVSQTEIAGGETAGTYLVDLERGSRERIEEPAFWVRRWRREGELGLMPSSDGIVAVSLDGEESLLVEGEAGLPDVSPNGSRIAFSGYGDVEGLRIVDVDSGEKTTLDVPSVTCVSWRPDSEALVFMVAGALYFNDLQGNPSVLVDAEAQESYMSYPGCNVVWIERGE
jgi:Tol biopolymer transport system component